MKNFSTKGGLGLLVAASLVLTSPISHAQSATTAGAQGKAEALWFGQAGFRIKSSPRKDNFD
ncbi:hypothetical protein [Polynucleobacter necessarius]|uniref:hypothetical protein n=1 Tax=Polynucleobacter necessarius TaxID=576610 RepID=UPI001E5CD898|nr:hypothetical protein [Polynucleobacter necessarius]